MKRIHLAVLVPLALSLTGCPGTFQQQKMQADVDGLKREMNDLRTEQKKGDGAAQMRQRLADTGAQLDQLRTDLSLIQGRVESLQNDLGKRGDESLKVRQDLEIRIAQLDESVRAMQQKLANMPTGATIGTAAVSNPAVPTQTTMQMATATPAPMASPMGTLPVPAGAQPPTPHATQPGLVFTAKDTDQTLYQKGVEAFDAKRYKDARETFGQVITKFPRSEFSDNARYWIGESYYAEKDFASAALEFEKVVKDYPNGDKVPAAMLKEGYAFLELGEKDGGAETLRELTKKYPKSEEAKKAKEKLSKLK